MMSSSNKNKDLSSKSASAGLLAAIVASLCCITPVFSLLAGVSGIAATFSWMEPFRPYLIVLTIGVLGFAWYQKLKPHTREEIECACDEQLSFWQSKKFLGIVTVFATFMLVFPSYSHIFYPNTNNQNSAVLMEQDTATINKIELSVKGMTCTGCESHMAHVIGKLNGIKQVKVSYEKGNTMVKYDPEKVTKDQIIDAINKTGYKVIEKPNQK